MLASKDVKVINGLTPIVSENLGQLSSKSFIIVFFRKSPRRVRVEISIILHFQIVKSILFSKWPRAHSGGHEQNSSYFYTCRQLDMSKRGNSMLLNRLGRRGSLCSPGLWSSSSVAALEMLSIFPQSTIWIISTHCKLQSAACLYGSLLSWKKYNKNIKNYNSSFY